MFDQAEKLKRSIAEDKVAEEYFEANGIWLMQDCYPKVLNDGTPLERVRSIIEDITSRYFCSHGVAWKDIEHAELRDLALLFLEQPVDASFGAAFVCGFSDHHDGGMETVLLHARVFNDVKIICISLVASNGLGDSVVLSSLFRHLEFGIPAEPQLKAHLFIKEQMDEVMNERDGHADLIEMAECLQSIDLSCL